MTRPPHETAPTRNSRRIGGHRTGVLLGCAAAGVLAVFLARGATPDPSAKSRSDRRQGPTVEEPHEDRGPVGVPPRRSDPASRDEFALPGLDAQGSHRLIAENAGDLRERLADGDSQWENLLIELLTSDEAFDAYWACSLRHLSAPCEYSIGMAVVPERPGRGTVGYVRVLEDADCPEYARCIADAFVGRNVPLPPDLEQPIGHRITRTDNSIRSLLENPELLERTIEMLRSDVANLQEDQGFGRGDWNLLVAEQRANLRFLERLLASVRK